MTTATFTVGKTYTTRAIGDRDCMISVTIDKRTAKTVTAKVMGEVKAYRVAIWDNVEFIRPWGTYALAPICRAL